MRMIGVYSITGCTFFFFAFLTRFGLPESEWFQGFITGTIMIGVYAILLHYEWWRKQKPE